MVLKLIHFCELSLHKIESLISHNTIKLFFSVFLGVVNFNGKDGCLKCTINGEYSHISRTVVFPSLRCPLRTDDQFRKKAYGNHHSGQDTPLLRIPDMDIIQDFIIADSLHLLELGVMKRLLTGWRDGSLGFTGKLSAHQIQQLSAALVSVRLPKEIHRKMRGMECLAFWKGTEWRSLLLYVGIVVLKDILIETLYNHFLLLFTAVTICSSDHYAHMRPVAQALFEKFIEEFKAIYGEQYITSNIHNLEHIVNDVNRFGSLNTISAYPFESYLFQIKKNVRQGNNCLEQVVNRMLEQKTVHKHNNPFLHTFTPKLVRRNKFIECEIREGLFLSNTNKNAWFLTRKLEIVQMTDACVDSNNDIIIHGYPVKKYTNFFEIPIKSSLLYIFLSDLCMHTIKVYTRNDVLCKFVAIPHQTKNVVFLPLLHTLSIVQ